MFYLASELEAGVQPNAGDVVVDLVTDTAYVHPDQPATLDNQVLAFAIAPGRTWREYDHVVSSCHHLCISLCISTPASAWPGANPAWHSVELECPVGGHRRVRPVFLVDNGDRFCGYPMALVDDKVQAFKINYERTTEIRGTFTTTRTDWAMDRPVRRVGATFVFDSSLSERSARVAASQLPPGDYRLLPPDTTLRLPGALVDAPNATFRWPYMHRLITELALIFDLPAYVLLWIINWLPRARLWTDAKKVGLIESIIASIRKLNESPRA